jgi:amino acid adenylation domain-containing protein
MDLSTLLAGHLSGRGGRPALESGSRTWSYDELDRVTRDRAAALRATVPAGGRVALAGDHTAESLIWALALMRSGLVYTPFNAGMPTARIREALDVAAPSLVLCCDAEVADTLHDGDAARRVVTAAELTVPPSSSVAGVWPVEAVAYSIFTSGSTGRPKLVNVGHRGIEHLCRAQTRLFGVRPGMRVVQFSSLSFDASVAEILVTLAAGATLVVPPWDGGSWVNVVGRYLREHGCDLVTLPPSVYSRLDDGARRGIRTIVFAGEALSEVDYRAAARHSRVFNAYGPTEGTVCFSVAELTRYSTSVGWPIDGYRAAVQTPDGYASSGRGELVLVGDGVALGYEGAEGLPFTTVDGVPAYHTGDEIELRDCDIHYLGRLDDQVKRLGHRIGLTDLEGRLARLLDSRVAAFLDGSSLVLAHTATDWSEPELRNRLRELLPPWEVPDVLLAVPGLPVTDAGKADKDALRALLAAPAPAAGAAEPAAVSDLVERVLGTPIDPYTSVFDAGGTSFTLVQLQVELAHLYGEQAVQDAFEQLNYDFTVAGFLAALDGTAGAPAPARQVAATVLADLATMRPATPRRATGGVILTGASGFIGGHVLDRLLDCDTPVTVVTGSSPRRLVERHRARFGREPAVPMLSYDDLGGDEPWGAVVHCGFEVNHVLPLERHVKGSIATTRNLVRAAAVHGAHRFVFLSAASVGPRFMPFSVDALEAVGDPYSQAKFIAETYVQTLSGDGCTVDLLRAGLVYGHTPRERDLLEHDVFASLLRLASRQGALPRLSGLVPVCHVDDVVGALLSAAHPGGAPPRREVLVQRTYDLDDLREETGLRGARLADPHEWLAAVTASGDADPRILAALRLWLHEAGWHEPVRTTDRPIIGELRLTIGD